MAINDASVVEQLAAEAVRLGARELGVEYKDGYEQVFVLSGPIGYEVRRFKTSTPVAVSLRQELRRLCKKKRRVALPSGEFELRASVYDSFGEDAFRVKLRLLAAPAKARRGRLSSKGAAS